MSGILSRLNKTGRLCIGEKPVQVGKITIAQWKRLFSTIETLPALIIDVLTAPRNEQVAYFVVAAERSLDEVIAITSVLTGIDEEYIENNADLNQLVEYFIQVAKLNDFSDIAKNVKSVLALSMKNLTKENAETNEE